MLKSDFDNEYKSDMKGNFFLNPVFLLLAVFLFFTSCHAQPNMYSRVNKVGGIAESTDDLPKMIKKQGAYSYMTHTGPHTDTSVSISAILEDTKGNIWLTTMGEGVYFYDGKTFTNLSQKDGLLTNVVYSIIEDKDGNLWFGTTNGVSRYNGKSFTGYPFSVIRGGSQIAVLQRSEPDLYAEVPGLFQDKNGKIWLGTTQGVYCYDGITFTNILEWGTLTDSLNSGTSDFFAVPSLMQDQDGNIWFTSWSEGLCRFDGTAITLFKPEGHLLSNKGLIQDKNGDIWIAERGYGGVSRYDGESFQRLFTDRLITDIKQDSRGNIWFGTFDRKNNSGGILCYNPSTNETISHLVLQEKTGSNYISCLAIDNSGNVWFGSDKMTLCRYDGKTIARFLSE